MQTKIKSEVDYKDPKTYGKTHDDALNEFHQLKIRAYNVRLCKIIGTDLYTVVFWSAMKIENKLKHLKIVM
jgi:hypothetical protein